MRNGKIQDRLQAVELTAPGSAGPSPNRAYWLRVPPQQMLLGDNRNINLSIEKRDRTK